MKTTSSSSPPLPSPHTRPRWPPADCARQSGEGRSSSADHLRDAIVDGVDALHDEDPVALEAQLGPLQAHAVAEVVPGRKGTGKSNKQPAPRVVSDVYYSMSNAKPLDLRRRGSPSPTVFLNASSRHLTVLYMPAQLLFKIGEAVEEPSQYMVI